ncbi:MAG TPA: DUF6285 domain-containing protein [Ilumatobacteraceae bacterium]
MSPHDAPSARQLVEAVREWLERDVLAATEGRVQFHTRVAINVLTMVERELELGPAQAVQHQARLRQLGVSSDAELAAAIRSGLLGGTPDDAAAVRDAVWASVRDKLAVANPKYLGDARS